MSTEGEVVMKHQPGPRRVIFKTFAVTFLAIACVSIGLFVGKRQEAAKANDLAMEQIEVTNILPFLQVNILRDDKNHVEGGMLVANDREAFSFVSKRDENTSTIRFECDKSKAAKTNEMDGWCGFDMTMTSDESKKITLTRYDGMADKVVDLPTQEDGELEAADISVMQSFIGSKVAEYYVGLTFKLAAMGKTGAGDNVAYAQMHAEAQWIFTTAVQDDKVKIQWDLGHEVTTGRRLGLHQTSIVEDLNRHLMGEDAADDVMMDTTLVESGLEWLEVEDHHGRMLGSCGRPYSRCGNNCYGMCGPGCTCWSWACGGCGCYDGCRSHDYYCSCRGWWHPYCIAAVWALVC